MFTRKGVEADLDKGLLNNDEWVNRWNVGDTPFQALRHDPLLDKMNDKLFEGKKKSVFVPLCGKSPDLIWMYEQGHTICGVEIAEKPIQDLFEENKIDVEIEDVEGVGKLYKSKDGRMKLFVADIFDFSKDLCGQFDVIWDSGSLVAINKDDNLMYAKLLISLMKKDCQYYVFTFEYEASVWPGPPHSISTEQINELYGDLCCVNIIEEMPISMEGMKTTSETEESEITRVTKAALMSSSYMLHRWVCLTLK